MRRDNFEKISLFRFVEFLREKSSFFKVWIGYSQSSIGSRFSMIARAVSFYQFTKSPSAVVIFSIFSLLPFIITSPFVSWFSDFISRKKILIFSQTMSGFLVLWYIVAKDPLVFYILAFLSWILSAFFLLLFILSFLRQ